MRACGEHGSRRAGPEVNSSPFQSAVFAITKPPPVNWVEREAARTPSFSSLGIRQISNWRRDYIPEDSEILKKAARPCVRHRRRLRYNRRFRHPGTAGRVGGGSGNRPVTVRGPGLAVVAVAGIGSGGDSGRGGASVLVAGGWGDCCAGHSPAEV